MSAGERNAIVASVLVTVVIHLLRAGADADIRLLFIANALGYLALMAALFATQRVGRRRIVRYAFLAYTAVTAFLYLLWGVMDGTWVVPSGPIKEAAELVLLYLLLRIGRHEAGDPGTRNSTVNPG